MIKGMVVHNPSSIVLVDNISKGMICLPRDGKKDVILNPGETAQITWAEFVGFKSIPGFGHSIKLNDSVVISDGEIKISNASLSLNDDYMIGILVQGINLIKEFILTLNEGDLFIFGRFLQKRKELGIESDKCEEALLFIDRLNKTEVSEEVDLESKQKNKGGRPKKILDPVEENSGVL